MPKQEWGVKRVCPTTGKRFYDMNRSPVVSPYTGEVVSLDTARQSRVLVSDKADRKRPEEPEEDELVLEEEEDVEDDSADVELDDDLLEDDDDDSVSLDDIADVPGDDEES
jgi:uncharacterized protein (TIGR02300 family)